MSEIPSWTHCRILMQVEDAVAKFQTVIWCAVKSGWPFAQKSRIFRTTLGFFII